MKKLLFIFANLLLVSNIYAANLETISPAPIGDWNYSGATVEIPNSTTLPATCTVGQKYQDTDAPSGLQSYACEEPGDNWVLQGDGGSVGDNDITEPKLKAVDSPVDEECLTYESTVGDFEWQDCGTAHGDGANCSAGQYPLGVDAAGAVQDCTAETDTTYTAGGDLLDLTGTVFQINEGVLVDERICNFEQTGSLLECNLNTDGSGDCMSGAVCLGDHTHSAYWDEDSDISADEISEGKINFSTACATGNHYYLSDNDLACEADDDSPEAGDYAAGSIDGDDVNPNIAGRSFTLTAGSPDTLDADPELYTDSKCLWFEDPTAVDDFKSIWRAKNAFTLTSIWAESDQTVTFMLQVDDGTPVDVDSVDLAPAAGEAEDTSLNGDTTMDAGDRLDLDVVSVSGTPTWVSICFTGTWND